jgi:hypothetical protein
MDTEEMTAILEALIRDRDTKGLSDVLCEVGVTDTA